MKNWNLDVLYKGIDTDSFQSDFKKVDAYIDMLNVLVENLECKPKEDTLKSILTMLCEYSSLIQKLAGYLSLRSACDTTDSQVIALLNQLQEKDAQSVESKTKLFEFISSIENIEQFASDSQIRNHLFFLKEIQKSAKFRLSDKEEAILSKMSINASSNWSSLHEYLTSTAEIEYAGEKKTLTQLRNLAYSSDKEVRKEAYECELKLYNQIKDAIAFSLNSIKGEVWTVCNLRGYTSPIEMTLLDSNMDRKTLDALIASIESYLPVFHSYLKRKAELLGYTNGLPWYELFASMGRVDQTYSIEEAQSFILEQFGSFSKDLKDLADTAFKHDWIDYLPRNKKVGGAFCSFIPSAKQSRILTNFDGSFSDVITLAHELGHAYHDEQIKDNSILNTNYSMSVAETASTFCETLVMQKVLSTVSDQEKFVLLESNLQDLTQIICDIYSRYLFESEVFERRKEEFLFAKDLEDIMIRAQKKAFGDGLDPNYLHPYMWVCKGHYYSANLSFYNFPYAFGGLFARGLYAIYQQDKDAFISKYRELLQATPTCSVEEAASKANVDVTDTAFWMTSLASIEEMIQEFMQLSKNY